MLLDASGELPISKSDLGRIVREAWVRWAQCQPDPKPSWLVPYDELCEADRDADDEIGMSVARMVALAIAARNGSPAHDFVPDLMVAAKFALLALAPMSSRLASEAGKMIRAALDRADAQIGREFDAAIDARHKLRELAVEPPK